MGVTKLCNMSTLASFFYSLGGGKLVPLGVDGKMEAPGAGLVLELVPNIQMNIILKD